MGTVLPDNPAAQLEFFQVHAPIWSAAPPAAIGMTDAQAAAVAAATARATAALAAAQAARQAARNATLEWEDAAASLRALGGSAITTIKAFAQASGDPAGGGVFIAASIEPPSRPGPKRRTADEADAALPRIRTCVARPNAFGGVEVEWTCGMGATMGAGAGMMYRVHRSLDRGDFALIDIVGSPGPGRRTVRFTDETVPTGTRQVEYTITPMRGSARGRPGPSALVRFGRADAAGAAAHRKAA
jgi:hypothetical protein